MVTVKFGIDICQILDDGNPVDVGTKLGVLFYLNCQKTFPSSYATDSQVSSIGVSFQHYYVSEEREQKLLEHVHSDVCGKIQIPSLGEGYYFSYLH